MGWAQLEAAHRLNAEHARADEASPTGDARIPANCPVCMARLDWQGRTANCPQGHYRIAT